MLIIMFTRVSVSAHYDKKIYWKYHLYMKTVQCPPTNKQKQHYFTLNSLASPSSFRRNPVGPNSFRMNIVVLRAWF